MIDALSDLAVRQAKPSVNDRKLADGRDLYLLVMSNGAKHWRLKYRLGGRERLPAIGEYPAVGLADGRLARDVGRRQIAEGIDPAQAKAERRVANTRAAMETFAVVAEEGIGVRAQAKGWTEQHGEQTRRSLRDFVLPHLGRRPIAAITAADVRDVLDRLAHDGKMETPRRVRQRIGGVFSFAVATTRRADKPVRELRDPHAAPKREHFASSKPDVVPLPAQAVALPRTLPAFQEGTDPTALPFPSPGRVEQQARENVVLQALAKMGYRGRLTGHGLCALVATAREEAGFPTERVNAQLSHAKANLTDAAYLRGIRLEQGAAAPVKPHPLELI